MPHPVAFFFSEKFVAAADWQAATPRAIKVHDQMLLPLLFEPDNLQLPTYSDEHIDYNSFISSRQNWVHLLEAFENEAEFEATYQGREVNLLIDRIIDAYSAELEKVHKGLLHSLPVVLGFPMAVAEGIRQKIAARFQVKGFEVKTQTIFERDLLDLLYPSPNVIMLSMLGGRHLQFVANKGGQYFQDRLQVPDKERVMKDFTRMIIDKALEKSVSGLVHDSLAREFEYARRESEAEEWLAQLAENQDARLTIVFPDGFTGTAQVSRQELSHYFLSVGMLLDKIGEWQQELFGTESVAKLLLLGSRLAGNHELISQLQRIFGADKTEVFGVEENLINVWMNHQLSRLATELLQEFQREANQAKLMHGTIHQLVHDELLAKAAAMALSHDEASQIIESVSDTTKVVRLMGIDPRTMLEEVEVPQEGDKPKLRMVRKIVSEQYQDDPLTRQKFVAESEQLLKLKHPHLASVTQANYTAPRPYYLSEYVEGEKLRSKLPLRDLSQLKAYAIAIVSAIKYLHQNQCWYKTLKSDNIFVDSAGHLKIAASGIEYIPESDGKELPGKRIKQNVRDVGIILLEMFTGKSTHQAIAQLTHKTWAGIVKNSSAGSSAQPYQSLEPMLADIEAIDAVVAQAEKTPVKLPIKKILAVALVALIVVTAFLAYEKSWKPMNQKVKDEPLEEVQREQPPPVTKQSADLERLVNRYNGNWIQGSLRIEVLFEINEINTQSEPKTFTYTLRLDSLQGDTRRLREFRQSGRINEQEKRLQFDKSVLGSLRFQPDKNGNFVLTEPVTGTLELK